jgi:hypothetical protein
MRALVSAKHRDSASYVTTPLTYPSGANVVVSVSREGESETFFVSDFGAGYVEADMMGASSIYARHARAIAQNAGVGFDEHAFFVIKASEGQLAGAIGTVANCSHEAVALSALRMADKKSTEDAEVLFERLVKIFTPKLVTRNADILGASHTSWRFASAVRKDSKTTIFEAVSKHPVSIATAATKFHDIALLVNPPNRVAVVRNKDELGTYLSVLSQAANVVSRDVANSTLEKLAADGLRYRALGNSMAVNCMRWLGRRIQMVDDIGE